MKQEARIISLIDDNKAKVVVVRGTACGSNCSNCESCIYQNEIMVEANNIIKANAGDIVLIETKSSIVFRAAAIVYIFPIVMLLIGFVFSNIILNFTEGLSILVSFLFLCVSLIIIVFSQKRKTNVEYDIVKVLEDTND